MFENPIILVVIVVAIALLAGAFFIQKNKQSGNGGRRRSSSGRGRDVEDDDDDEEEDDDDEEDGAEDEHWGSSGTTANSRVDDTKVSVQEVDPLNEFNVYKQFGYYEKAAESLSVYMKNYPDKVTPKLVAELLNLWLESKKVDQLSDSLTQYKSAFPNEILADYIKKGLALDENHLGLRVLAESCLGWGVKKTAQEIGEKTEAPVSSSASERPKTLGKKKESAQVSKSASRKPLVVGEAALGKISSEEQGAVLSFMEPEQSVKLLKGSLTYDLATKFLNKAIRTSAKPAALLIDALTLDFKAKNVDSFAEHLWHLYHNLGQSGRQVKERMLGLGYTLGEHPVFESLEAQPTAESLLMYGQLDQSLDLLERAIKAYPQESQLYVALFDLYERAEEWERLEKLLQDLRTQIQTLPEEVVLAMSQLLQRFNNGSFGH